MLEAGEGCDDGNTVSNDGCNSSCEIEDGGICNADTAGEIGDNGCESGVCDTSEEPDTCEPGNTCGNNVLEFMEACDDGNTVN